MHVLLFQNIFLDWQINKVNFHIVLQVLVS